MRHVVRQLAYILRSVVSSRKNYRCGKTAHQTRYLGEFAVFVDKLDIRELFARSQIHSHGTPPQVQHAQRSPQASEDRLSFCYSFRCENQRDDTVRLEVTYVHRLNKEGAGKTAAQRLSPVGLSYYDRFGRTACAILDRHTVGSLASLAVRPNLRGQGIGQRLTEEVIRRLRHMGCDLLVAISWASGGSYPSRPLFEKLGFRYIAEAPDVYLEDSLERGLVCDFCGGACHCSGILYVLDPRDELCHESSRSLG